MRELSRQREFTTARPGEGWEAIARRALPERSPDDAVEALKGWNLHLFTRQPSGEILGSDVVFLEPPLADTGHGGA